MLHDDWIVFATLLCKIHLKVFSVEPNFEKEFDYYLRNRRQALPIGQDVSAGSVTPASGFKSVSWLTSVQNQAIESLLLSDLTQFRPISERLINQADEIKKWVESTAPELAVPILWDEATVATSIGKSMRQLIIIQAFRPDRIPAMTNIFVRAVLGARFVDSADTEVRLADVVEKEIKASTPVLMCSAPGYDASGRIDDLAAELSRPITSLAMGSAEGFNQAEGAINSASKNGKWVLLKNVHLAPQWLVQLEKKLYSLEPHSNFRLFLTLEIQPKIPVNLLRAGRVFVYEPPPGIKANLLRTFNTIPASQMMRTPNERSRLYFLLAWFHAIVQERLRYRPLGWSKSYEFNESDLKVAVSTLDTWLDAATQGRNNIAPEKIPWDAICTLLGECIYGGKVDNIFDHRLLKSFLRKFFTSKSFEANGYALVEDSLDPENKVLIPEGIRRDEFLSWIEALGPSSQSPTWLGLPPNAERVILRNLGQNMISKLLRLQALEDNDEVLVTISQKAGDSSTDSSLVSELSGGDVRPTYMRDLAADIENWLKFLPERLDLLRRNAENIKDPLFRYFEREVSVASKLLVDIRRDLCELRDVCDPDKRIKQTNYQRTMIERLVKEQIPEHWVRYKVLKDMKVRAWITDFNERIKQLNNVVEKSQYSLKNLPINLGRLLNPEAYITATRQYIAQANSWSLEELELEFTILDSLNYSEDSGSFTILGLYLEGATSKNNKLYLTTAIITEISLASMKWVKKSEEHKKNQVEFISLPVYLDQTRDDLLFTIEMQPDGQDNVWSFFERGVAVICSSASV